MTGNRSRNSKSATLLWRPARIRERVVVALNDTVFASWIARHVRRLGWGVHLTQSGSDARRLCQAHSPQVVVLDTQLPDQSGWLTCEKILRDDPTIKVILFASHSEPNENAFADFVGPARLIRQNEGIQAVVDEIVAKRATISE